MKLFECQSCGHPLYFENTKCERCHHQTGYLPDLEVVSAVEPRGDQWVSARRSQQAVSLLRQLGAARLQLDGRGRTAARRCAVPASTTAPFPTSPIRRALRCGGAWRRPSAG